MAENYKHLYEQTKKMLTMYQDELIPGFRKKIEELEAGYKWIPTAERLPQVRERVLAYTTRNEMVLAKYTGGSFYIDCIMLNVTHWIPLPEPPKGGVE